MSNEATTRSHLCLIVRMLASKHMIWGISAENLDLKDVEENQLDSVCQFCRIKWENKHRLHKFEHEQNAPQVAWKSWRL